MSIGLVSPQMSPLYARAREAPPITMKEATEGWGGYLQITSHQESLQSNEKKPSHPSD